MPLPATQVHETMQKAYAPTFPNGSLTAGRFTLVFRIRHTQTKRLLKEHRLILAPSSVKRDTESRTALYYTQGRIVADTPAKTGVGMTVFTITGHTGFRGVLVESVPSVPPGDVEQGPPSPWQGAPLPLTASLIDGAAAIKDLQDTILAYFFPPGFAETREATRTQDLQLEFLDLLAPTSASDPAGQIGWVIHPHRGLVSLGQDAAKPFLYQYQFQFAAVRRLEDPVADTFVQDYIRPQTGLQGPQEQLRAAGAGSAPSQFFTGSPITLSGGPLGLLGQIHASLRQATAFVRQTTAQINTIEKAFHDQMLELFVKPVQVFTKDCTDLFAAVGEFVSDQRQRIAHPLYATTFAEVLDLDKHSVSTLKEAAIQLGHVLTNSAAPTSTGRTGAGTTCTAGANDTLTLSINHEPPVTVALGTQTSGPAIAAAIETEVQSQPPAYAANASGYSAFTATYDPVQSQYVLSSGTTLSDAGAVEVVVSPDPDLVPTDVSSVLGLGVANGGQEQAGTAAVVPALALLRGVEEACTHLLAFPDYFADQLEAQDAALVDLLPPGITRTQIRGDQRMQQTRVTPGDSLQGIAARVGVPWETLALVNRLTYPYILEQPSTLVRGRVSSAGTWHLTDLVQAWPTDLYQGERLDILAGPGAGQSRRILRNTGTQLVLEHAWDVVPNDTSDYAIRRADNPIVLTGIVTSSASRTLTDAALALVPDAQRGLTLVLTSGPSAGERRRIVTNDHTTYYVETPWIAWPEPGTLYLLLGPAPATTRQKLVGDLLSVPRPSAETLTPIRSRLQDVSAMTGQEVSTEEQLFGRDLLLDLDSMALVYDSARGDARHVAGLVNLEQALKHYINLPIGELEYQPGLGSFVQEELGLTATLPLQVQLLASVHRTIRQDARIARMNGARLLTSGGVAELVFSATAINGSTVERVVIR
jgi:LysM domain